MILSIDADGLASEEGTLRVGDRIIAVNDRILTEQGLLVRDALCGLEQAIFVASRCVLTEAPPPMPAADAESFGADGAAPAAGADGGALRPPPAVAPAVHQLVRDAKEVM